VEGPEPEGLTGALFGPAASIRAVSNTPAALGSGAPPEQERVQTVLVYSSSDAIRARVKTAVGRRPVTDLGPIQWVEAASGDACIAVIDAGGIDLVVLDGEAWPTGGMGIARQVKDEYADPPATLLLVARADDRWLASWSRSDAIVPYPIDPFVLTDALVGLLRARGTRPLPEPKVRKAFGVRVHEHTPPVAEHH
jgi:DNA-binding response OmpR family regulator